MDYFDIVMSVVCLIIMVACIFLQVIFRYLFNSPLAWSEELARYTMISLVYFGIGLAIKEEAHMSVTMLQDKLPESARRVVIIVTKLIMLVLYGIMCRYAISMTNTIFSSHQVTSTMRAPMGIFYICLPVGFAIAVLREIESIVNFLKKDKNAENSAEIEEGGITNK